MQPTLHLLMGLPGSGKTTLSKYLEEITNSVRLSSDEYRLLLFSSPKFTQKEHDNLYETIDSEVEQLLKSGVDVIYDANLNRRIHRQEKYELADKYESKTILWWVRVPNELAKSRRINEQNLALVPEGDTPERMFDRVSEVFETPQNEPHIIVDGTKITKEYIADLLRKNSSGDIN